MPETHLALPATSTHDIRHDLFDKGPSLVLDYIVLKSGCEHLLRAVQTD